MSSRATSCRVRFVDNAASCATVCETNHHLQPSEGIDVESEYTEEAMDVDGEQEIDEAEPVRPLRLYVRV